MALYSLFIFLIINLCIAQFAVSLSTSRAVGNAWLVRRQRSMTSTARQLSLTRHPAAKAKSSMHSTTITMLHLSNKNEGEDGDEGNEQSSSTRLVISGLASLGAVETAYLTWAKLTSSPLVLAGLCSAAAGGEGTGTGTGTGTGPSCSDVLNSPYATIPFFNAPLSAVAFVAYLAIAFLASDPTAFQNKPTSSSRSLFKPNNSLPLIFTTMSMAAFSTYLMGLLAFVLHASCPYCYLSAFISFSVAALSLRLEPNAVRATIVSGLSVCVSLLTSAFMFYSIGVLNSNAASSNVLNGGEAAAAAQTLNQMAKTEKEAEEIKAPPPITKPSSSKAMSLAQDLKKLDARMYGAYWCSHCFNQKQNLGTEAKEYFEYIECDKEGVNSQFPLCKSKKVPGYPTWEIQGKLYPGEKSVDELQRLVSDILQAQAQTQVQTQAQ